jgi:SAM-dependent methyltransferase
MHPTAMSNAQSFFDTYSNSFEFSKTTKVIEIGSQDVNGSLRDACPTSFEYLGLDFQAAKGVDVVLEDPYSLPFSDESIDIVITSSCFEHSEMFWLVFLEVLRVLKPSGLFYLNVPSAGNFHQYPVDCWRFYPDSGRALVKWSKRNGLNSELLESYIQLGGGQWQDFVGIFIKSADKSATYPSRILDKKVDFENGILLGVPELLNPSFISQNEKKLGQIVEIVVR